MSYNPHNQNQHHLDRIAGGIQQSALKENAARYREYRGRDNYGEEDYAGFWLRFLAVLIDGFILWIPRMLINSVFENIWVEFLLFWLYYAGFHASQHQATPG